jgi:hypothetical protein
VYSNWRSIKGEGSISCVSWEHSSRSNLRIEAILGHPRVSSEPDCQPVSFVKRHRQRIDRTELSREDTIADVDSLHLTQNVGTSRCDLKNPKGDIQRSGVRLTANLGVALETEAARTGPASLWLPVRQRCRSSNRTARPSADVRHRDGFDHCGRSRIFAVDNRRAVRFPQFVGRNRSCERRLRHHVDANHFLRTVFL